MSNPERQQSADLEEKIRAKARPPFNWVQPRQFDLSRPDHAREVDRMLMTDEIVETIDRVDEIADGLFEVRLPGSKNDIAARQLHIEDILSRGPEFGQWFLQDGKTLVRYADKKDHRDLYTSGNKSLIRDEAQGELLDVVTGTIGGSVGSSISESLTYSGIGGTMVHADYDRLSVPNLNRIKLGMAEVGLMKVDNIARVIGWHDPFKTQHLMRDGVTPENIDSLENFKLDILYDAIDDLPMKAALRVFAAQHRIPLMMATDVGHKSILDIERYDIDSPRPFNGRLSEAEFDAVLNNQMSEQEKKMIMIKLVGVTNITPRMAQSHMEIGKTIRGIPQLGTTATIGGALATIATRELFSGRRLPSGRHVFSPRKLLKLGHETRLKETIKIAQEFFKK